MIRYLSFSIWRVGYISIYVVNVFMEVCVVCFGKDVFCLGVEWGERRRWYLSRVIKEE